MTILQIDTNEIGNLSPGLKMAAMFQYATVKRPAITATFIIVQPSS